MPEGDITQRVRHGWSLPYPRKIAQPVILGARLREGSLCWLLADHGQRIFPDGYFADVYAGSVRGGRRCRPG
jgi:hypothetical protein